MCESSLKGTVWMESKEWRTRKKAKDKRVKEQEKEETDTIEWHYEEIRVELMLVI